MRKRSRGNSDGDIKRGERKRKAEQQEPIKEDSSQHINFFSDLKTGVCGLHVHVYNDANVHVCSLCTYIYILYIKFMYSFDTLLAYITCA